MPDGKTLYLMRHADAVWPKSGQRDFDRSLSLLGQRDAREMGRRLGARSIQPDVIFSSPARRAAQTLELIKKDLGIPDTEVVFEDMIYEADVSDLLKIIHALTDDYTSMMIIGHNPALTWLINKTTGAHIANAPTGSLATIHTLSLHWQDFGTLKATLKDLDYPKNSKT